MTNELNLASAIAAKLNDRTVESIVNSMPEDIYETGDVLVFQRQFVEDGPIYTYACVKAAGRWYRSGNNAGPSTWAELLAFMYSRGLEGVTMYETSLSEVPVG